MSWICGYTFVAGLLATCMTVAYSMGEYILSKYLASYRFRDREVVINFKLYARYSERPA